MVINEDDRIEEQIRGRIKNEFFFIGKFVLKVWKNEYGLLLFYAHYHWRVSEGKL